MIRAFIHRMFCLLGLLLVFVVLNGANCPRNQAPIPTYVLAWTGTDNQVNTLESRDAITWLHKRTHTGSISNAGPVIAHDGHLGWMLMWTTPTGGGLKYLSGIGSSGSTSSSSGILWGADIETINISSDRYAALGTPTLAYGNNGWVVAFDVRSGIQVIREVPQPGPIVWESVMKVDGSSTPAIAFGQNKFVLTYSSSFRSSVAITSTDGITWSPPNDISIAPRTLSYYNGFFYAVVLKRTGGPDIFGQEIEVYKSVDGINWSSSLGERITIPRYSIVGGCYGPCKMVVFDATDPFSASDLSYWIGTPPENECNNPSSLNFGSSTMINEYSIHSISVAFGDVRP